MRSQGNWQILIQKHLDGQTTTVEAEELSNAIIEDPMIRSAYLKAARIHAELTDELLSVELQETMGCFVKDASEVSNRKITWGKLGGLGIAALLLMGLAVTFFLRPDDSNGEEWGDAIAKIVEMSEDAVPANGRTLSEGALLKKGWIVLKEGKIQLKFRSGAMVTLEGPSSFGVDSAMRSYLEYGKVSVYAPESARDFVVATTAMEVVDLGTRFQLLVDPESGESVVDVSEGLVDLHLGSRGTKREIQPLEAGWKAVVDGSGEIQEMQAVLEGGKTTIPTPLAYWKLDAIAESGLVPDSSQKKLNGVLVGDKHGNLASGVVGGALDFSKTSAIDLSSHVATIAGLDSFTFSAWIRDPDPGVGILFSVSDGTANNRIQINLNQRYLVYLWQDQSARWDSVAGRVDKWEPNQWYHVVVSVGPTGLRLFQNGKLLANASAGGQIGTPFLRLSDLTNPSEVFLGHINEGTARTIFEPQWFGGVMDEVQIFGEALDHAAVEKLYQQTRKETQQ